MNQQLHFLEDYFCIEFCIEPLVFEKVPVSNIISDHRFKIPKHDNVGNVN